MLLVLLSLLLSAPTATFTETLDARFARGEISALERFQLIEWAVKRPQQLPTSYRKLLAERPLSRDSVTAVLVENFQRARQLGLRVDYSFPEEMAFYLDSDIYPIRVYYAQALQESMASTLLSYAESAWEQEIDNWGFYAPPVVSPEGRYRIYLGDAAGAAGYTAPIDEYPDTEWDDCVTYIVIEEQSHQWGLFDTMAHELNHATQAAMDCLEPTAFWENTAVFTEVALNTQSIYMAAYYSESFQLQPYKGLSGGSTGDLFWYGGYLWPLFLADHLGSGPGDAVTIRQIWEDSMQSSGFSMNSPSYFDAIEGLAADKGTSLSEVFDAFSRARWFVDSKYSSQYSTMPYADQIYPVPTTTASLTLSRDPQLFTPDTSLPQRFGTNYIPLLKPSDYNFSTLLTLVAPGDEEWRMQLISRDSGALPSLVDSNEDGVLQIEYDPELYGNAVLIVEHLASDSFNPNNLPTGESYTLQVRPALDLPVITLTNPDVAETASTITMNVYGANFQEGAEVVFVKNDYEFQAEVLFESSGKVVLTVPVPAVAPTGAYDITLTNPDGGFITKEAVLTLSPPTPKKSSSDGGFFDCSTSRGSGSPLALLALILGIMILRPRFI